MKIKKILSTTLLSLASIGIGMMVGITGCSEGNKNTTAVASQEHNMKIVESIEIDGGKLYKIEDKNPEADSNRYIYVVRGYGNYPMSISATE